MKRFTFHLAAVFIAVAAFVAVTLLDARTSSGQSQSSVKTSDGSAVEARVKPTSRVRAKATETAIESTTFGPAATRNGLLRSELNWTFGGKEQRGWQLYTPANQPPD